MIFNIGSTLKGFEYQILSPVHWDISRQMTHSSAYLIRIYFKYNCHDFSLTKEKHITLRFLRAFRSTVLTPCENLSRGQYWFRAISPQWRQTLTPTKLFWNHTVPGHWACAHPHPTPPVWTYPSKSNTAHRRFWCAHLDLLVFFHHHKLDSHKDNAHSLLLGAIPPSGGI